MDEISIIVNGERYDTSMPKYADNQCDECDLRAFCSKIEFYDSSCVAMIGNHRCFIKSTKDFER